MKTQTLFHQRITTLLITISLFVSLACMTATVIPSNATSIPSKATGVPSSASPDPVTPSAQTNVNFGAGPFNMPNTRAGLADLSSYTARLTLTFDGTNAGQTQQWSKTYLMLAAKKPALRQLTIEKTGNISDLDPVFMAESNGVDYERRGKNGCAASVIEEGISLFAQLEPAGFLNVVIGADDAGNETVNDVASHHYTFDQRAFGQPDIAKSTGELWVASDGGYIVKYLLTTTGKADYFGEGIEGSLTWDYELSNINQPVAITLPDDCPGGLVNAPLLPDASEVLSMPGLLTYHSSSSPADASAFYQREIPNLGWELSGEPGSSDTSALLDYIQADKALTIIITSDDSGTTVNLEMGKSSETVLPP